MILPKDYREFIALLNGKNVKYVLVGAHANAYHGVPRSTGDIDFFVEKSGENMERIAQALVEFGYPEGTFPPEYFLEDVVQIGFQPQRIDIITSLSGVSFDEVYSTAVHDVIDNLSIPIISLDMLIKNRLAVGRYKDLADVEDLQKVAKRKKTK